MGVSPDSPSRMKTQQTNWEVCQSSNLTTMFPWADLGTIRRKLSAEALSKKNTPSPLIGTGTSGGGFHAADTGAGVPASWVCGAVGWNAGSGLPLGLGGRGL